MALECHWAAARVGPVPTYCSLFPGQPSTDSGCAFSSFFVLTEHQIREAACSELRSPVQMIDWTLGQSVLLEAVSPSRVIHSCLPQRWW